MTAGYSYRRTSTGAIFVALRQMEAKFEQVHAELAPKFKGRLKPTPADYQARGVIFLPENARFSRLLSLPGTEATNTYWSQTVQASHLRKS